MTTTSSVSAFGVPFSAASTVSFSRGTFGGINTVREFGREIGQFKLGQFRWMLPYDALKLSAASGESRQNSFDSLVQACIDGYKAMEKFAEMTKPT